MSVKRVGSFAGRFASFEPVDRSRCVGSSWFDCESPETLSKTLLCFAVDDWGRVVVALHCPDPVVDTVLKIADATVRVFERPTGNEFLPHVGNIVPGRVLHKHCLLSVLNENTATVTNEGGRDT